ncbi:MAG: carbonic anhydrase family protein [Burkholderiaceae bacterium]|nr:carbonic anhydrase family protein [Burkholderiaceae bacterium]
MASDAHGDGHAAAAKPAAKAARSEHRAEPKAEPKPAAKGEHKADAKADPMDQLREKLAAKLGATKAPEAPSPYVVRVVSKTGEAAHGGGAAAKAAEHGEAAATVKKLRAAKAADKGDKGGHAAHWAYKGDYGPEQWGAMKPEFGLCAKGSRQSPIDIRDGIKVDLEPIQFDYRSTGFAVIDNGHTVQVNLQGGNAIEVSGRRFDLVQFHFHRPSEERINGRQFDMVAHLVHRDPEGKLAVVAVLLDRGSAHPIVQTVWNNLPLEKGLEQGAQVALDLNSLLPADRRYYTYMGSLTTPPCSEGVLWLVMQQPVPISNEQIAVFSKLYPMNARPVQQASGRLIKQSN